MEDCSGRDVAIDLATANMLVFVKGQGIVLSEPSVVAIDTKTDKVVAVGSAAKRMLGRTPGNIVAMRPLKDGVIAIFEVTEKMLAYFIRKVQPQRLFFRSFVGPRVVVCVPSGVTGVELRAVKEATESAGARQAYTIEEPLAAAIGAYWPLTRPRGRWSSTSAAGRARSPSSPSGRDRYQVFHPHRRRRHRRCDHHLHTERVQAGHRHPDRRTAQDRAWERFQARRGGVGRDKGQGPRYGAAQDRRNNQRGDQGGHKRPRRRCPRGRARYSGPHAPGARLRHHGQGDDPRRRRCSTRHLDERLRRETGIPVHVADDALMCVAIGSGRSLEEINSYRSALSSA